MALKIRGLLSSDPLDRGRLLCGASSAVLLSSKLVTTVLIALESCGGMGSARATVWQLQRKPVMDSAYFAYFDETMRGTNNNNQQIPLRDVVPQVPLQDVIPQVPLRDAIPQVPLRDVVPQIPSQDAIPQDPLRDAVHQVPMTAVNGMPSFSPVIQSTVFGNMDSNLLPANQPVVLMNNTIGDTYEQWNYALPCMPVMLVPMCYIPANSVMLLPPQNQINRNYMPAVGRHAVPRAENGSRIMNGGTVVFVPGRGFCRLMPSPSLVRFGCRLRFCTNFSSIGWFLDDIRRSLYFFFFTYELLLSNLS
uniref:DUF4774 domain-containing protein n=1 Tax=Ascaris lumbricoides TaxID=6252 RepID=A0A0M3HNQ5_ASCLU